MFFQICFWSDVLGGATLTYNIYAHVILVILECMTAAIFSILASMTLNQAFAKGSGK